jgi:hypothetical protein
MAMSVAAMQSRKVTDFGTISSLRYARNDAFLVFLCDLGVLRGEYSYFIIGILIPIFFAV